MWHYHGNDFGSAPNNFSGFRSGTSLMEMNPGLLLSNIWFILLLLTNTTLYAAYNASTNTSDVNKSVSKPYPSLFQYLLLLHPFNFIYFPYFPQSFPFRFPLWSLLLFLFFPQMTLTHTPPPPPKEERACFPQYTVTYLDVGTDPILQSF